MKSFAFAFALAGFGIVQSLAQVALTVGSPAISPSPVVVTTLPALTPPSSTAIATNTSLLDLAQALVILQTNVQQTLPALITFNDNFDFVSLGDNGLASTAPAGNFSSNLATNFAANFAVNAGVNAGVNAATPTGPSLISSVANAQARAAANPSAAGLPAGFAGVPFTRDTLRALLVLESDLQRLLPLLNSLNSGSVNNPGSFTNLFGVTPTSP